jgi:hypothetical protein
LRFPEQHEDHFPARSHAALQKMYAPHSTWLLRQWAPFPEAHSLTTDGQSVSKSWCRAQSGTFDQRYISFSFFFLKLQSCLIWGALSDERSGLSFVIIVWSSLSIYMYNLHFVLHISQLQYLHLNIYNVLYTFTIK